MRESAIEQHFHFLVRQAGGMSIKLAPTHAGVPDRLVLFPGGRSYLVELKAVGGVVSRVQQLWHDQAGAIGHKVHVVTGSAGVDNFITEVLLAQTPEV